jgi:hypothetical protein
MASQYDIELNSRNFVIEEGRKGACASEDDRFQDGKFKADIGKDLWG